MYESVDKVLNYKKTPKDLNSLYFSLKNHFTLYNLEDDHLESFISTMFFCEIREGEVVFSQGDSATTFFVIGNSDFRILFGTLFKPKEAWKFLWMEKKEENWDLGNVLVS